MNPISQCISAEEGLGGSPIQWPGSPMSSPYSERSISIENRGGYPGNIGFPNAIHEDPEPGARDIVRRDVIPLLVLGNLRVGNGNQRGPVSGNTELEPAGSPIEPQDVRNVIPCPIYLAQQV